MCDLWAGPSYRSLEYVCCCGIFVDFSLSCCPCDCRPATAPSRWTGRCTREKPVTFCRRLQKRRGTLWRRLYMYVYVHIRAACMYVCVCVCVHVCIYIYVCEWIVLAGSQSKFLCFPSLCNSANALVVGTRGRGKVKRMFLGSTADFLIHHAHCTVCVTLECLHLAVLLV